MNPDFWTTLLTFPTVLFTVLLGVMLLYWILVILGALDLDWFDLDLEAGSDLSLDTQPTGLAGMISGLGLGGVPLMIVFSLLVFFAWTLSVPATAYLVLPLPGALLQFAMGLGVLFVSVFISLLLTARMVRPLRKLFASSPTVSRERLAGKLCVITTGRVDEHFGQAQFHDGGAGLILSVRAETPNTLGKGRQAIILEYQSAEDTYWVAPFEDASANR